MQQYVEVVLKYFFDSAKLKLKRLPVLAHECSKRCPLPLVVVGINEYVARLPAKAEQPFVSIDHRIFYQIDICGFCIFRERAEVVLESANHVRQLAEIRCELDGEVDDNPDRANYQRRYFRTRLNTYSYTSHECVEKM